MAAPSRRFPLRAAPFVVALSMCTGMAAYGASTEAPSHTSSEVSAEEARAPVPVEIRGKIRDANGSPVRRASVRLMSETDTLDVVTDASGRFRGSLPARRTVAVRVRAAGYRDFVRYVNPEGHPVGVSLTLPPPYPMASVTVTASLDAEDSRPRSVSACGSRASVPASV